jgi:hypothetical protein
LQENAGGGECMREYLFHAKRVDTKEWIEGNVIDMGNQSQVFITPIQNHASYMTCDMIIAHTMVAVIPETVGQFSELEYNFHKYFEHDICEMDIPTNTTGKKKEIIRGYIIFMFGSCFLEEIGLKKRRWIFSDVATMAKGKVIYLGNIHDNPKLLEEV